MGGKSGRGSSGESLAQQAARDRRGAPGAKRFVGGRQGQQQADRAREVAVARRLAEIDAANRRAMAHPEPVVAVVAELIQDVIKLVRTLGAAPFRIAMAMRAGRVGAG